MHSDFTTTARGALAVLVAGVALAAPAAGTAAVGDHATCRYDVRGAADPGLNSLSGIEPVNSKAADNSYELSGPVTCQGSAQGRTLPARKGTMTIAGADQPGDVPHNSCLSANVVFTVNVVWARTKHAPAVRLDGSLRMVSGAFDALLVGDLGGSAAVGRAGVGLDPDRDPGICTDQYPYRYFTMAGDLVLGGTPGMNASGGTSHQDVIAGLQYVGGGTINSMDSNDPNVSVTFGSRQVTRGDTITWTNLDTHPHTITSCSAAECEGGVPAATLPKPAPQVVGSGTAKFPKADGTFDGDVVQVGDSYTLDTSTLAPGKYTYFCEFHPFMRGSFTVVPKVGR